MNAGIRIVDTLLVLETVCESADRAVRVTVGGQSAPVVRLAGVVGHYSGGALGTVLADVATEAFARHYAAALGAVADAGALPDPDAGTPGTPAARWRARAAEAAADLRVVVDSPAGLVTIELTGNRQVGAWISPGALRTPGITEARLAGEATAALSGARVELARRVEAIHREAVERTEPLAGRR